MKITDNITLEIDYRDSEQRNRSIRTTVPEVWLSEPDDKLRALLAMHIGQVGKIIKWQRTNKEVSP